MRHRFTRTKIIATVGPASNTPEMLRSLLVTGVDTFRLNFSHGTHEDHARMLAIVRSEADKRGKAIAVLLDLQGPKIRVGKFADGKVTLETGMKFVLDASRTEPGDIHGVGLDYKELPRDEQLPVVDFESEHECFA